MLPGWHEGPEAPNILSSRRGKEAQARWLGGLGWVAIVRRSEALQGRERAGNRRRSELGDGARSAGAVNGVPR